MLKLRFPKTLEGRLIAGGLALAGLLLIIAAILAVWPLLRGEREIPVEPLPDFSSYASVSEKKAAFFDYLFPLIDDVNEDVLSEREEVEQLAADFADGSLSDRDAERIREIATEYDFEDTDVIDAQLMEYLLTRVDAMPPSLVMAQAALESGWGSSRFAREGNNLFGMRCYTPGCGIIPNRRPAGATFEVTAYPNPKESLRDYIHNLNTNNAYFGLRAIRKTLREAGEIPTGFDLAEGLVRYSERGWEYVGMIRNMIQSNNLAHFDQPPMSP